MLIERFPEFVLYSMRSCWGSKWSTTVHNPARHSTSLTKCSLIRVVHATFKRLIRGKTYAKIVALEAATTIILRQAGHGGWHRPYRQHLNKYQFWQHCRYGKRCRQVRWSFSIAIVYEDNWLCPVLLVLSSWRSRDQAGLIDTFIDRRKADQHAPGKFTDTSKIPSIDFATCKSTTLPWTMWGLAAKHAAVGLFH